MTDRDLVTAPLGTTLAEAEAILHRHKIEKLPVVDSDGVLKGLITVKDIQKRIEFPKATKDEQGRLRVGAAVGVGTDAWERASALVDAGALAYVAPAHAGAPAVRAWPVRLPRSCAPTTSAPGSAPEDGAARQGSRAKAALGHGPS